MFSIDLFQVIFGNYRYAHTNYYSDNEIGFQHLFLKVSFIVHQSAAFSNSRHQ